MGIASNDSRSPITSTIPESTPFTMKNPDEVAVFWDYENCPAPTNASGYVIVNNIRTIAQAFGSVKLFKAYLEVTEQVPASRAQALRSELQSSGVSLTDCPHNGRKDVADKMILVDMLAHAIDNPAPSSIVLISGDRDFAYALSILRLRRYRVILITLSNAHQSLRAQASICFDWSSDVLEQTDSALLHQPTSPRHGKASSPPAVHDKKNSESKGCNLLRSPFRESHGKKTVCNIEFINSFQDPTRRREDSPSPKCDARHDFLPPDLELSKGQLAVPSVTPDTLRNKPESPERFIYTPVASSYHTCIDNDADTMTTQAHGSNSPTTTITPDTSVGSTPKPPMYADIIPSGISTHIALRRSTSLPNLKFTGVIEPMSFESVMRIPAIESDLGVEASPSSQQDLVTNSKSQSPPNAVQIGGGNDDQPDSPPAHSDMSPPLDVATPLSSSASPSFMLPSSLGNSEHCGLAQGSANPLQPTSNPVVSDVIIPPSSLSNATVADVSQGSVVKAVNPLQPISNSAVLEKYYILIQCLKAHRSRGTPRPLRTKIALEIADGATYRRAGVLNFGEYVAMAEREGIIEMGGSQQIAWVALKAPDDAKDHPEPPTASSDTLLSNVTTFTPPASAPYFIPSLSLSNVTISGAGPSPIETTKPVQPPSIPTVPDKFKFSLIVLGRIGQRDFSAHSVTR